MSTWMYKVFKEIEDSNPENLHEPIREMQPEDHLAGEVDPDMRKLYSYATGLLKEAMQAKVEADFSSGEEAKSKMIGVVEKKEKSKALLNIFWISAKDAFGLWDKEVIGIRRGWKIIWTDESPTKDLITFLSGIPEM